MCVLNILKTQSGNVLIVSVCSVLECVLSVHTRLISQARWPLFDTPPSLPTIGIPPFGVPLCVHIVWKFGVLFLCAHCKDIWQILFACVVDKY